MAKKTKAPVGSPHLTPAEKAKLYDNLLGNAEHVHDERRRARLLMQHADNLSQSQLVKAYSIASAISAKGEPFRGRALQRILSAGGWGDKDAKSRRIGGDTRVDAIRKTYGNDFAKGVRGDMKLKDLLEGYGSLEGKYDVRRGIDPTKPIYDQSTKKSPRSVKI